MSTTGHRCVTGKAGVSGRVEPLCLLFQQIVHSSEELLESHVAEAVELCCLIQLQSEKMVLQAARRSVSFCTGQSLNIGVLKALLYNDIPLLTRQNH